MCFRHRHTLQTLGPVSSNDFMPNHRLRKVFGSEIFRVNLRIRIGPCRAGPSNAGSRELKTMTPKEQFRGSFER